MQDADTLAPGLMIIHGNRLETLRELVVDWMRTHPLGPLENEVILVQSNGIAQWLQMALAADTDQGGSGIAAALDVQLPARFLWDSYRGVLGRDAVPEQSPLDKQPLLWRLMRLLPELLEQPEFVPLKRFLADDSDCRKRYQLAERLADLFDQYQVYRADWLNDWAAGEDRIGLAREGFRQLEAEEVWQPALWRAVLADVGIERLSDSRAGIHPRFVEYLLNTEQRPASLPRRVIVFGISSLPAQTLEALAVIGRFSQVLLGVLNPCQFHWGDIVADQDLLRHQYRRQQRRPGAPVQLDDSTLHQHAHPLLAAWGKQGRDYINLLDQHDERAAYEARFAAINGGRVDLFDEPQGSHLLAQLQSDILELRPLTETREHWPALQAEQDHSLRFHLAHSPQREVEILHDQLLDAFANDPTLKPRDIIVMVPDVNTYAPHIQAVFGQYSPDDPRAIPYTLADQGQRGQEPLLIALEHLLRLPDSRLPVSEVFDLLDVPALRNRFELNELELPTLHRWIEGAGVRWGLDQQRREALGMPAGLEANSWRFGLRRMLLGYAGGGTTAWQGIEPYDEIGGLDAALIGPLSQLLQRLDEYEQQLRQPAAPVVWGQRLRQLLEDFFSVDTERDQLLLAQLHESLANWLELCEAVKLDSPLPLNVVVEAWLDGAGQSQLSQRFLAGAVNVCTLMPMRAIPFKRICLLGMNDGDYPRAQPPLDFDLMGRDYRPGDRSRREDDRYLLLEALLSARDGLYISWVGRSIRDNSERPPSVLVGQLRDHLAAGWCLPDGGDLLAALTTEHPLQPFSRRYFSADSALFSYAREWRQLHNSRAGDDEDQPLAPATLEAPIELLALQRFLRNPVEHFFAARLKVWLQEQHSTSEDDEPFALDGLQRHQLSQWLLEQVQQGDLQDDWQALLLEQASRLQQRGSLPLAGFGELTLAQLVAPLGGQLERFREQLLLWDQPLENPLLLQAVASTPDATIEVVSWLAGVRRCAPLDGLMRVQLVTGSLLGKKGALRWRKLLGELCQHVLAAASGHRLTTCLIGADASIQLLPLEQERAASIVRDWLLGYLHGLSRPLPVAVETAFAWLTEGKDEKRLGAARLCYQGNDFSRGEVDGSPALQRSYPDFASLQANDEFIGWAQSLYHPLAQAIEDEWLMITPAGEDQA
ncbi:exodeoxyribonuclease V subunit gamma [Pseudomonas sp. 5Ae-yellow]|uniref:exodeoxyribonuclease V subunit gamma n=1 Tax=Pseudomonas sp. 5Ae-yellow TaxID=2759848 RepID=UPI0015F5A7FA|nr:exodeoxyribonuclease V subunit gamma [Pseudomonas sp. 5Ae-yellow]MBA6420748.1 exodeoxyribonuclease V subunit gamma [Pseudomonas sp. 5Ae-yellow]|tara:strand:+ start:12157 stop:15639 length:3483 start_codon:yes stop_codon:yes gene_type:complete